MKSWRSRKFLKNKKGSEGFGDFLDRGILSSADETPVLYAGSAAACISSLEAPAMDDILVKCLRAIVFLVVEWIPTRFGDLGGLLAEYLPDALTIDAA